MKLTIDSIQNAMTYTYPAKGDEFWLDPKGEKARIVEEATKKGYLRRFSHTQVEWTEEGLKKARQELEGRCDTCGSIKQMSESPCCMPDVDRDEEARQLAKDRYSIVKGLWFEPTAKIQTTSDGKCHVMCWIQVDE